MLDSKINIPQFKDNLVAQKTPSGQKGLKIGSKSLGKIFLPLTDYLVNNLWKQQADDSTQMTVAKTAARGLTYFFTVATAAPMYQFLLHALPKKIELSNNHTQYAKAILESLSQYNTLREKIIQAGDHERDYLAPHNINGREAEIDANEGIIIKLSPEDKTKVKENIRLLQNEKAAHYDVILDQQVKEITTYLQGLEPEERVSAYKEILGAFMTHVGFDHVFIRKNERVDFALEISNRIGLALIQEETKVIINELATDSNFIQFNHNIEHLATEIANLFGITQEISTTLVAHSVKEAIHTNYGSLERFAQRFVNNIGDSSKINSTELQVHIDSILNNYNTTIAEIENKNTSLINGAILKDAEESLKILNTDISQLRAEARNLNQNLHTINEKLKVLGKKGSYYKLQKIKETKEQLEKLKQDVNASFNDVLKKISEKLKELASINNMKAVNFNGPEIQELKTAAAEKLELERNVRTSHENLGIKNKRAFRACMHLLEGVSLEKPPEMQCAAVNALTKDLHDESKSFNTTLEKLATFFGYGPKMKPVALFDVLRHHLNTFELTSLQARNSVRAVYEQMTPSQQAYFTQELARQAGKPHSYFQRTSLRNFGKSYLEAYIAGNIAEVDGVAVHPHIIKHVVESKAGRDAALYQPYTRLNDYWWQDKKG